MKRLLLVLVAFTLVACAPVVVDPTPATNATLTASDVAGGTLYRVVVAEPIERLVLLFTGEGLSVDASECEVTPADVVCVMRDVFLFYEVTIAGDVTLAEGIIQRGSEYGLLTVTP